MLAWLWQWWRGRRGGLTHLRVVMYTRRGCHLCDAAWELLERARERYGFALEAVDVDTDPELAEQYGLEVPVVVVNGKVRFRGVVNPHLLRRLLIAEGQASASRGR
jgi:glutaredoxin